MAKNAANEAALGGLHARLATVFNLVLKRYEAALAAVENIDRDALEEEMLAELLETAEPNPAMLSAVSKFLKDNNIGFDEGEVEELNATARRLEDRRKARKAAGLRLVDIPAVQA